MAGRCLAGAGGSAQPISKGKRADWVRMEGEKKGGPGRLERPILEKAERLRGGEGLALAWELRKDKGKAGSLPPGSIRRIEVSY